MFSISRQIVPVMAALTVYATSLRAQDEPVPAPVAAEGGSTVTLAIQPNSSRTTQPDDPTNGLDFDQVIPELTAKDAEFQNIIRLIALKTNLNILLDPEEIDGKKRITFQLRNVTLGTALDTILKTHKLAYVVEKGGIIRIVPEGRVGRAAVETKTEIIALNWRDAVDMEKTFKSFLTSHGTIKSNDESQALIIIDVPPNVLRIKELIAQLDKPDRQVMIECRLVDLQIGSIRTFATEWGLTKHNRTRTGVATRTTASSSTTTKTPGSFTPGGTDPDTGLPLPPTGSPSSSSTSGSSSITENLVETLSAPDSLVPIGLDQLVEGFAMSEGIGALQFGSMIGILGDDFTLDAFLLALEGRDMVEIIAAPRVTTLNNVIATIDIIQQIPFAQGEIVSQTAVRTIRFQEAGEKISVKPIITPDGHVRLDINLLQSIFRNRVGPGDLDPPIMDDRKAKSTVIVKDKSTVVLGGLRELRRSEIVDAFPWFWRIPLIGWAFKDKSNDQNRTELVLMVTPNIVEQALLNDREKELYDSLDSKWHMPDYFMDDVEMQDNYWDRGKDAWWCKDGADSDSQAATE